MGGCFTKEKAIACAQYLGLIDLQFGTLDDMFPDAPRLKLDLIASKSPATPHVDGVNSSVSQTPAKSSSKKKSVSNTCSNDPSRNPPGPGKTSEVHIVQTTTADKSSKGKNK